MKIIKLMFACLVCLPFAAHAQATDPIRFLKILPAPKEVRLGEGSMAIKPSTTILIANAKIELPPKLCKQKSSTAPA